MARYIDADKLINEFGNCTLATWGKGLGASWWSQSVKLKDNMVECINKQPTADVVEVKHGYDTGNANIFECSVCGYGVDDIYEADEKNYPVWKFNYCPHCGAKMDGGKAE